MSKYPAIGDPQPTVESILETVRSIKIAVEMLSGQREGGASVTRFEQNTQPGNPNIGDIWVNTADPGRTFYWNGSYWVDISNSRFSNIENALVAGVSIKQEDRDAMLEELFRQLNEEASQVTTAIDSAVEEAREELAVAVQEANDAIADVQADADSAFAELATITQTIYEIRSDVDENSAAITVEAGARATAVSAIAGQITTINAQVAGNTASIVQQEVARVNLESALAATNSTLTAKFNEATGKIEQEAITRATADNATSVLISSLQATVNNNKAQFDSTVTTLADADSALSGQFTSLQATVNNNKALFDSEVITRANADSVLSGRVTNVEASTTNTTGNGVLARLITEELTRAAADGAVATALTAATVGMNRGRVFQQTVAPSSVGRQVGDVWYDTDDNYRPYYWTGSAWVDNSSGTYKIGAVASIQQSMTAMNDAVQWGIQGTIAGQPAGSIALTGWKSPTTGEVRSLLKINSNVEINGNLLVTGSANFSKIASDTENKISNGGYVEAYGLSNVLVYCRAGAQILVVGTYAGGDDSQGAPTIPGFGGGGGGYAGMLRIFVARPEGYNTVITEAGIKGVLRDWSSGVTCTVFGCATTFTNYYTTVSSTTTGLFTPAVTGWHNFYVQPFSSDPNSGNPTYFSRLTKLAVLELAR